MRKLVTIEKGERYLFFGTFDRFSRRYDPYLKRSKDYIIIKDITDEHGNHVSNFVCFDYIKGFAKLMLQPGDRVSFRARVVACQSQGEAMYYGHLNAYANVYYRLMNPSKVTKLQSIMRPLIVPTWYPQPSYYQPTMSQTTSSCPINIMNHVVK